MAIQPEVTAGGSRQRVLVLALAGVLLLVLVGLLARPLLLGGSAAPAAAPVTAGATPTTVAQLIGPSTSVAGPTAGTGKDPFRPAAGAVPTATTVTTAVPTTTTPAGAGAGTATVSGSGTTAQREVAIEDVFGKSGNAT
jgi:hypothetical protein